MTLTLAEVEHIARLARLELSAAEKERFQAQLSAILDYAGLLQQIDTQGTPPTFSVIEGLDPTRPDQARPGFTIEQVLQNTAQAEQRQFRLPPVFE
jgi:aspartyl-tRNA(Asn)/glutamyl-tRNA(Gln) amidotransferase subunit C